MLSNISTHLTRKKSIEEKLDLALYSKKKEKVVDQLSDEEEYKAKSDASSDLEPIFLSPEERYK